MKCLLSLIALIVGASCGVGTASSPSATGVQQQSLLRIYDDVEGPDSSSYRYTPENWAYWVGTTFPGYNVDRRPPCTQQCRQACEGDPKEGCTMDCMRMCEARD